MSKSNTLFSDLVRKILSYNVFPLLLCLLCFNLFAQQDNISFSPSNDGQTYNTCSGFIIDSGGQGGSGYSVNENFTITLCPDTVTAGDNSLYLTVSFNLFLLDLTNTGTTQNPNQDYMSVYDGPDDSYTTLGTYNGNELQNVIIAATNLNATGCLTFTFYSNTQGTGQFAGSATCTEPCVPPIADAFIVDGDTNDSIRVCIGETVTFDASASYAQGGFDIAEYSWNFLDGTTDNTTGAVVSHTFNAPGQYQVQLTLTDNNEDNPCQNLNVVPLKVYVSTYPTFYDFPADTIICLGESLNLVGISDFGQYDSTWVGFPTTNIVDDGCLTDQQLGVTQTIPMTYTEFDPSDVISSADDINSICVNMEHSFMGDLVVQLVCPNGTSINLQTQGGGGTQIGVPNQADNVDCDNESTQGEGWEYCWTAGATQTWTEWVGSSGGGTLPEGNYASVDPLSDLIGCPLTGTWQLNFTDNWSADDGTVFEFGITFHQDFYPDIVEFTNTVGESSDSSFWDLSDPYITANTSDLNEITINPTATGNYSYNYHVVNNFGCEFDSTVTVTVVEPPEITAGPDLQVCEDPVTLQAGMGGANPPECGGSSGSFEICYNVNETIVETYCPDNPGDGLTYMSISFISGTFDNWGDQINIYNGDNITAPLIASINEFDLTGLTYTATNTGGCITLQIISGASDSCEDGWYQPINYNVSCADPGLVWSWTPTVGLSNPNVQNPTAFVEQATIYTVTVYDEEAPGCVITDQVLVAPDPTADPGIDNDTTFCYNSALSNLTNYLDGNPAPGGNWINLANNETVPNLFNPTQFPDGANFTFQYTVSNGQCEGTSELNITILPSTNNTCCQTNADAGPDAVACDLIYQLSGSIPIGSGSWSGPDNVSFSNINDRNAVATYNGAGGGIAVLTWTDSNGAFCEVGSDVEIIFSDPVELALLPSDAVCYNECTGNAIVIPDGGTVNEGSYNIIWSDGAPGTFPAMQDSLCAGFHSVKVTDNFGCADSLEFEIDQPAAQKISVQISGPSCADQCDAQIKILSEGAINYSFDDQETWGANHIGLKCAGPDTVYARNAAGCVIAQPVDIINPTRFEANFNVNPTTTTTKNTLVTFQDVSEPGPLESSLFTIGDDPILKEIDQRFISFRFPSDTSGTYPIQLISTSIKGCQDTIIKMFEIRDDLLWYIPNSFSPNEDGINDIWRPVGNELDITDYRLSIYDRWGKQVFFTTDFTKGWNGSVAGSDYYSDAAVFTYLIKVTSATTKDKYEFTGSITLIR